MDEEQKRKIIIKQRKLIKLYQKLENTQYIDRQEFLNSWTNNLIPDIKDGGG